MLNRRALRIKAMQRLYAWNLCKQSNIEISLKNLEDRLRAEFKDNYPQVWEFLEKKEESENQAKAADQPKEPKRSEKSDGFAGRSIREERKPEKSFGIEDKKNEILAPEVVQLKKDIAYVKEAFKNTHVEKNYEDLEVNDHKSWVVEEVNEFQNRIKQDFLYSRKEMESETENIKEHYLLIIKLLVIFVNIAKGGTVKRKEKYADPAYANLQILQAIEKNEAFVDAFIRHDINWNAHQEFIHKIYLESVYNAELTKDFRQIKNPTTLEEREYLIALVRDCLFKNESFAAFFDEKDVNWKENKLIVRSMVGRSIKSMESFDDEPELSVLSYNWEEDKQFLKEIYTHSVENDSHYQKTIIKYVENWDADRLALIDLIIIKMALGEMVSFPNIPVKVTINEYIEVTKQYSTAKSKQFVNGLLDKISKDMVDNGEIKKSGRGLIDNQ